MSKLTPDEFRELFTEYSGQPHQMDGLDTLYYAMPVSLLEDDSTWIIKFTTPLRSTP